MLAILCSLRGVAQVGEQLAAEEEELWAHVRTAVKARQSIGQSSRATAHREAALDRLCSLTRTRLPPPWPASCALRADSALRRHRPGNVWDFSGNFYMGTSPLTTLLCHGRATLRCQRGTVTE